MQANVIGSSLEKTSFISDECAGGLKNNQDCHLQ